MCGEPESRLLLGYTRGLISKSMHLPIEYRVAVFKLDKLLYIYCIMLPPKSRRVCELNPLAPATRPAHGDAYDLRPERVIFIGGLVLPTFYRCRENLNCSVVNKKENGTPPGDHLSHLQRRFSSYATGSEYGLGFPVTWRY